MPNLPDPEHTCEQVLEAVGHSAPPTDLNAVCSLWPDLEVDEEDLDKEGYLIPLGIHGAEILVRRSDPTTRKKFTLAHELGHWTLANLEAGQVSFGKTDGSSLSFRTHHKRQTPEEVWCNKFAACLLMPMRDMYSYFRSPGEGNLPGRILKGHSVFQVSHEAFLARVSDITPINVFEVVSTDANAKIRRRFLSGYQRKEQVEQVMNELLRGFHRKNDLPKGPVVVDSYQVQTKLTHKSQYNRSWLVSLTPVTNNEMDAQFS